jgi:hypothetical protein
MDYTFYRWQIKAGTYVNCRASRRLALQSHNFEIDSSVVSHDKPENVPCPLEGRGDRVAAWMPQPSLQGYGAPRRTGLQDDAGTGLASGAGAELASTCGVSPSHPTGGACYESCSWDTALV